tara:strand:+ start:11474 stop:12268 length:795 start_codon:yes stop_codon:yes gene_type:complete
MDDYFTFAKGLVYEVGNTISRKRFTFSNEVKRSRSPDTIIDSWIAQHIKERFEARTGILVYSESYDDPQKRISGDTFAWLDPIDGTRSLTHEESTYSISLGLIRRGRLLWGVVYQPHVAERRLYSALRNQGVFRSIADRPERRIKVSSGDKLRGILGNTFSGATTEIFHSNDVETVGPVGGFVYKVTMVADGRGEGYVKPGDKCNEWDSLAAQIILEEAGGRITDRYGRPLQYNKENPRHEYGIVASNGKTHDVFLELCDMISK